MKFKSGYFSHITEFLVKLILIALVGYFSFDTFDNLQYLIVGKHRFVFISDKKVLRSQASKSIPRLQYYSDYFCQKELPENKFYYKVCHIDLKPTWNGNKRIGSFEPVFYIKNSTRGILFNPFDFSDWLNVFIYPLFLIMICTLIILVDPKKLDVKKVQDTPLEKTIKPA